MHRTQTKPRSSAEDDELVDVLTAISVVSMRLARKLTLLAGQSESTESVYVAQSRLCADEPDATLGKRAAASRRRI